MWHCQLLQDQEAQETYPEPGEAGYLPGSHSTQQGLPRPCCKEGACVSRYLTVMQPRVCEDGLPALGQPKQAPSRLQSVKSSDPITGGSVSGDRTPIAESSLERQPEGGLAHSCRQPGPKVTPAPQRRQKVSSRVFSSFPQLERDISHTNPVHSVEGRGQRCFCSLSLP